MPVAVKMLKPDFIKDKTQEERDKIIRAFVNEVLAAVMCMLQLKLVMFLAQSLFAGLLASCKPVGVCSAAPSYCCEIRCCCGCCCSKCGSQVQLRVHTMCTGI